MKIRREAVDSIISHVWHTNARNAGINCPWKAPEALGSPSSPWEAGIRRPTRRSGRQDSVAISLRTSPLPSP
eukprot:scaffold3058_cov134-Isochrysis_galbana.AAC.2